MATLDPKNCTHDYGFYVTSERGGKYQLECVNCGKTKWLKPEEIRIIPEDKP